MVFAIALPCYESSVGGLYLVYLLGTGSRSWWPHPYPGPCSLAERACRECGRVLMPLMWHLNAPLVASIPSLQALSALSATHHTLSQRAFEAVIQALVPDLGELSHVQQLDMLAALLGPGEQAPESKAGPFLAALTRAIASSGPGGLGAAPAELLFAVMNAAARWQVALGQEWVREVEQELARGLSVEGEGKTPAAVGAGAGAGVEQGPPAAVHSVGALRRQLMSDVFLPAVRRGQPFSKVWTGALLHASKRSYCGSAHVEVHGLCARTSLPT